MIEWVKFNTLILSDHHLICTCTTGALIEKELKGLRKNVTKLKSGPFGGDQKMGARITADYMISSPLFEDKEYTRIMKDYIPYMNREL